jgi:hypothetical protein
MSETSTWPETEFACNGGGGCVIVKRIAGAFVIFDSKNPHQPGLVFTKKEYREFRDRVRDGSWPRLLVRLALRLANSALRFLFG